MSVKTYFERTADNFDALYENRRNWSYRFNQVFRKGLFQRIEKTTEALTGMEDFSVLDVGCGSGRNSALFAEEGARRVVGIDFSAPMLELAREYARAKHVADLCEFMPPIRLSRVTARSPSAPTYLSGPELPGARVLEIGCGTRAISRIIGHCLAVEKVRRHRPIADMMWHRVRSHVPQARTRLAEAFRAFRPGGWFALFDGNYAPLIVATGADGPLQPWAAAFAPAHINDPWVVRRFAEMIADADARLRGHGYVQVAEPQYMLSIVDRGANALVASGRIGAALGEALKSISRLAGAATMHYRHCSAPARIVKSAALGNSMHVCVVLALRHNRTCI